MPASIYLVTLSDGATKNIVSSSSSHAIDRTNYWLSRYQIRVRALSAIKTY